MDMATGTEGQGVTTPQPSAQPQTPGAAPEGFVEAKRLNGALQKIQELTLLNQTLTERLTNRDKDFTNLQADLTQKEAAWNASQSEFTSKLASAENEKSQLNSELAKSNALKLKLKLIGEMNAPQLYSVIDVISDTADEAAMKDQIGKLAGFAANIAKTREQELTAGVTTIPQGPSAQPQLPTTNEGWQKLVGSLPFGSPEYQKAMEGWHSWLFKQS